METRIEIFVLSAQHERSSKIQTKERLRKLRGLNFKFKEKSTSFLMCFFFTYSTLFIKLFNSLLDTTLYSIELNLMFLNFLKKTESKINKKLPWSIKEFPFP